MGVKIRIAFCNIEGWRYGFDEQIFHIILPKNRRLSIKEDIAYLLGQLKKYGKDRRTIEEDLNYSLNYIDQQVSKGGNKRFLAALRRYFDMVTQQGGELREDPVPYGQPFWSGIPEYRDCDHVLRARGESMAPLIRHNALVGGKRLADPSFIVLGEVYIVRTRNGTETIRYVQSVPGDPESLLLVPLKEGLPATPLRKADILEVYQARFVLNPL